MEQKIEQEITAKGLTAPRLDPEHIDSCLRETAFYVFPGTALTVCAVTLKNGFIVTGTSSAVSISNFDKAIGEQTAFANAREKVWELEGYLLREAIHIAGEEPGSL